MLFAKYQKDLSVEEEVVTIPFDKRMLHLMINTFALISGDES